MIYQCLKLVIMCDSLANSHDPPQTAALAHNLAELHALLLSWAIHQFNYNVYAVPPQVLKKTRTVPGLIELMISLMY